MGKYKRATNRKRTYEEVEVWYQDHLEGKSLKWISKKYNTDAGHQFRKFGFKLTKASLYNTSRIHKIYYDFKKVENETEAYILGLVYADGHITKNGNNFGINLHIQDEAILSKVRDYMCPEKPFTRKGKNGLCFILNSQQLVNNIQQWGVTSTKTKDTFNIPNIDSTLYPHFIRGYFDGDGTVFYDRQYLKCNICSVTPEILYDFQTILAEKGIDTKINKEIRQGKKLLLPSGEFKYNCMDMYRLFVRKKDALLKFHSFLYDNCTIRMDRKFDKFNDYVNSELTSKITQGLEAV